MTIATCIKGIRLLSKGSAGAAQKACELTKSCTAADLRAACDLLKDQALLAAKIIEIGGRHPAKGNESVSDILNRAAAVGDEEAQVLIACGILERGVH